MQIEVFDPVSTLSDGIVVFPARIAIPERNSNNTFKYQKSLRRGDCDMEVVSCVFDKSANRVRLLIDRSPRVVSDAGLKYTTETPEQQATVRTTLEVKLDIPRGAISTQKVTTYEIIEAPNYWDNTGGKLRSSTGAVSDITSEKMRKEVYHQIYAWLKGYYEQVGCPEKVDRRKLPDLLKSYTGELREKWRVAEHNFTYPANALATTLTDMLTGRRMTTLTLDQLLEWNLIPGYPTISKAAARAAVWDSMRTTSFIGVYLCGGRGRYTKNTQLCYKLSNALGTSISLQELDRSVSELTAALSGKPSAQQPNIVLNQMNGSLYFLGVTKTTQRQEAE